MSEKINKKVKVFSTPTCPWCNVTKEFLTANNVEFEDVNVASDNAAAQQMVVKSGQMGVPQIWIDDAVIVGFNKHALEELLEL